MARSADQSAMEGRKRRAAETRERRQRLSDAAKAWHKDNKFTWRSQALCAAHFNVSESSLSREIRAQAACPGRARESRPFQQTEAPEKLKLFSAAQQEQLITHLVYLAEHGFPRTYNTVIRAAKDVLRAANRKTSKVTFKWAHKLVSAQPRLHLFASDSEHGKSLELPDRESGKEWFTLLEGVQTQYNIGPDDTFNLDEVCFLVGRTPSDEVIVKCSHAEEFRPADATNAQNVQWDWVTMLQCICANGTRSDPFAVVETNTHPKSFIKAASVTFPGNMDPEALTAISDSEVKDANAAAKWLSRWCNTTNPTLDVDGQRPHRLLIVDDHASHCSFEFIKIATDHKIIVLCLPPFSSHLLQPLDAGCFDALRLQYTRHVEEGPDEPLGCDGFLHCYAEAWNDTLTPGRIIRAFDRTGIQPYNPGAVDLDQLHAQTRPRPPPAPALTASAGVVSEDETDSEHPVRPGGRARAPSPPAQLCTPVSHVPASRMMVDIPTTESAPRILRNLAEFYGAQELHNQEKDQTIQRLRADIAKVEKRQKVQASAKNKELGRKDKEVARLKGELADKQIIEQAQAKLAKWANEELARKDRQLTEKEQQLRARRQPSFHDFAKQENQDQHNQIMKLEATIRDMNDEHILQTNDLRQRAVQLEAEVGRVSKKLAGVSSMERHDQAVWLVKQSEKELREELKRQEEMRQRALKRERERNLRPSPNQYLHPPSEYHAHGQPPAQRQHHAQNQHPAQGHQQHRPKPEYRAQYLEDQEPKYLQTPKQTPSQHSQQPKSEQKVQSPNKTDYHQRQSRKERKRQRRQEKERQRSQRPQ